MALLLIAVGLLSLTSLGFSQRIPPIACPNVFKYAKHDNLIHGVITVPNDFTGVYEIAVNVSLATLLNKANIKLTLLTTTEELNHGADPVYKVDFPIQTVIPKITNVLFNGKVFCSGPPEVMSPRGVTNMWATRTLYTNVIPSQPNQFVPTQRPYGNNPFLVNDPVTEARPIRTNPPQAPPQVTSRPIQTILANTKRPQSKPNMAIKERFVDQCGIFSQQLIVGGVGISKGDFPWLVAIFQRAGANLNYVYRCTGNLVSSKHIISAGHCFKIKTITFPKEDYTLVLGKQDISDWPIESTLRGIRKLYVHDNYKENTADNDIAIIEMDRIVEFTEVIRPLCIWSTLDEISIAGKIGTVIGWGTDGIVTHTSVPNKIDLTVISNEECLRSHGAYAVITSERTFCAGGNGNGPCTGDSGAGLLMQREGRWTLRGIVSQALQSNSTGVCDLSKYIVFADIRSFANWIRPIMSDS